jgi:hypothetical protein
LTSTTKCSKCRIYKVDEFHHQTHKYLKGPSPVILEVKAIRVPEQLPSLLKLKKRKHAAASNL